MSFSTLDDIDYDTEIEKKYHPENYEDDCEEGGEEVYE